MTEKSGLAEIAYILVLVGGILLVIFGLLSFTGYSAQSYPELWHWGIAYGAIVSIIAGIIAIIGSRSVTKLVWAIVLLIFGLVGGGLGGLLVVLGALIGLVLAITKRR